jgi:F0F1-type ATP synthase membrane subunit b/b'
MGFLDRLLGRTKDEAEDVTDKAKTGAEDMGQKAQDMGDSAADSAKDMGQEAKTEVDEHMPGRDTP